MNIDVSRLKEVLALLGLAISKDATARPITKMLELSTKDNYLYGFTTDAYNSIKVKICATTEDMNVLVSFATFNDVIKNCENTITLKATDKFLSIKTDVLSCKIPVHPLKNKNTIKSPDIPDTLDDIDFSELKSYMSYCKTILDTNFTVQAYRHIYFDDNIMVSDTDNVAIIRKNIFNKPIILRPSSTEILSKLDKCKYATTKIDNTALDMEVYMLHIKTDDIEICIMPYSTNEFQYDDLMELFDINIKNNVIIDRAVLAKAVTMSQLFNYDPILVFDSDGVSLQINQVDFKYSISSDSCEPHSYKVTVDLLKKILSNSGDITLYFDDNDFIKCISDSGEQILSAEAIK